MSTSQIILTDSKLTQIKAEILKIDPVAFETELAKGTRPTKAAIKCGASEEDAQLIAPLELAKTASQIQLAYRSVRSCLSRSQEVGPFWEQNGIYCLHSPNFRILVDPRTLSCAQMAYGANADINMRLLSNHFTYDGKLLKMSKTVKAKLGGGNRTVCTPYVETVTVLGEATNEIKALVLKEFLHSLQRLSPAIGYDSVEATITISGMQVKQSFNRLTQTEFEGVVGVHLANSLTVLTHQRTLIEVVDDYNQLIITNLSKHITEDGSVKLISVVSKEVKDADMTTTYQCFEQVAEDLSVDTNIYSDVSMGTRGQPTEITLEEALEIDPDILTKVPVLSRPPRQRQPRQARINDRAYANNWNGYDEDREAPRPGARYLRE